MDDELKEEQENCGISARRSELSHANAQLGNKYYQSHSHNAAKHSTIVLLSDNFFFGIGNVYALRYRLF